MFGLGMPELTLILVIALVLFGAKNLPELGKTLGKTVHELRKATGTETEKPEPVQKSDQQPDKDAQAKK